MYDWSATRIKLIRVGNRKQSPAKCSKVTTSRQLTRRISFHFPIGYNSNSHKFALIHFELIDSRMLSTYLVSLSLLDRYPGKLWFHIGLSQGYHTPFDHQLSTSNWRKNNFRGPEYRRGGEGLYSGFVTFLFKSKMKYYTGRGHRRLNYIEIGLRMSILEWWMSSQTRTIDSRMLISSSGYLWVKYIICFAAPLLL